MSPTKQLETSEQVVAALGDLRRMKILEVLTERAATVKELAEILRESPQTTNYHTKLLEKTGLIEIVEKREVRGTLEKLYRAVADRFVIGDVIGKEHGDFGFGLVENFLELGRYAVESVGRDIVTLLALGIRGDRERVKEFQARLGEVVKEFQDLNEPEGQQYGMVVGLFPIAEDAVLPEHPASIFESGGMAKVE
jgi:DNA-binding transcriptional ArsR family regulator